MDLRVELGLDVRESGGISDKGLAHLAKLHQLKALGFGTRVTSELLQEERRYPASRINDAITDIGLGHIAKLDQLSTLSIGLLGGITDAGLKEISKLSRLANFAVDFSHFDRITDEGVKHLSDLPCLRHLRMVFTAQMTDIALAHVAGFKQLATLRLRFGNVCTCLHCAQPSGKCPTLPHMVRITLGCPHAPVVLSWCKRVLC